MRGIDLAKLIESAQRFAIAAIEDHEAGRNEFFALHAGAAFEKLCKAALVRKHVGLLAEPGAKDPHLLYLLGVTSQRPPDLRTVGGLAMVARLRLAHPELKEPLAAPRVDHLLANRNDAAHLYAGNVDISTHMVDWARACYCLTGSLDGWTTATVFWRSHLGTLMKILEDHAAEVHRRIQPKLEEAQRTLQQLKERLGPDGFADHVIQAQADDAVDLAERCPVCGSYGRVDGTSDVRVFEADGYGDYEEVWFNARSFSCPVCGLKLRGADEMEELELPIVYRINENEPAAYESGLGQTYDDLL